MAYNCDASALRIASTCFREGNNARKTDRGIELYARVAELAAIGGANYTGNIAALMTASNKWRTLAAVDRRAIGTYRAVQDAVTNGAAIATDINSLKKNSACYAAIGDEDQENLLSFLSCAIGVFNKSEGD